MEAGEEEGARCSVLEFVGCGGDGLELGAVGLGCDGAGVDGAGPGGGTLCAWLSGARFSFGGPPISCSGGGAFCPRFSASALAFAFSASMSAEERHLPAPTHAPFRRTAPATVNNPCDTPVFKASYTMSDCSAMGTGSAL